MMPAYMIIESKVLDSGMYQEYISEVQSIVSRFGGKYLARGNDVVSLSDDWKPERIILIEFPARENIMQWLSSGEYGQMKHKREQGAISKAIIIDGSVD